MSGDTASPRARELREAFDRSFAKAPPADPPQLENLLSIRVTDDPYVIRLADLAGLFADKAVTSVPGADPGFLGIAGFRGVVLPVYDLRVLLGYPAGGKAPRWLAVTNARQIALAFDALDGYLRVPRGQLAAQVPPRPLIDLNDITASIEQRLHQPPHPRQERET